MVFDAPPATATHSWMPSSPCGAGCIEPIDQVGTARMLARLAGVVGLVLSFPVLTVATPKSRRENLQRSYARAALGCLGMRLRIVDRRAPEQGASTDGFADSGTAVMVVAGHIGWTDIVALAAVQPVSFVARADMVEWPVLGKLARLTRVIPIERAHLRALPGVVDQVARRLAEGNRIAVFPEGTTWCGRAYGSLRPAMLQAAIDTTTPVQPVRLRYLDRHGTPSTVPGFVGDDTFADSAERVLRSKGMVVEIVLEPLERPGLDRRDLARRCEAAIRGADRSRHGVFDTEWIASGNTRVQDPSVDAQNTRSTSATAR
ncbi:1-acyl-sn-glycerol-3-phosphate acyltransferase [Nocardia mangyaensis]|uniref:1-acyl-sn-glycerol-3-phosphate acyltransferase n=1 Tax=Nocardia mangyaensis TaxID=2213200 RepID=A0A1J0VW61_9NOCA|nr:lysophospholipid acyltransferase family protein [Nocardia mangyaensis]APE36304.1 1-acyl-sn-glycerol-3-phosphate acyltransferase [Nocardia mangyaensis]